MIAPRVFTIPAGEPFADILVEGVLSRYAKTPLGLAEVEILVPTRRAVRGLREAFLRASEGAPLLLPRIQPIGDVDEEGLVLEGVAEALDLPPAIDGLRRDLMLARLVRAERARIGMPVDWPQAIALAGDLARLLDRMQTENADPAKLQGLAPADFAVHWQLTLDFLAILTVHWPKILAEDGAIDPADRRNRLIGALSKRWRDTKPAHPIVAAGSTGSIPATAELLKVVAGLPAGAVVLPGLDQAMDEAGWLAVEPNHPQAGLRQLLSIIGTDRASIMSWVADRPAPKPRAAAIAAALDPAATADFAARRDAAEAALADLVAIDAPSAREEADAIALLMREALETPARTAALVTPDRSLARSVAAALRRWGIEVDDSAGAPLARTAPATYLRLLAEAATEPDDPVTLLALLKHPLARAGSSVEAHKAHVRALDFALRGPRRSRPLDALPKDHAAAPWAARVREIIAPFGALVGSEQAPLRDLLRAHVAAAEALAAEDKASGAERLWAGDAGEALADFVAEIDLAGAAAGPIEGESYGAVFDALLAGRALRARFGAHPRLAIWGLLEARLQRADVVILGGLNEGTWPAKIEADPWMGRAMAAALGLAPPERRIGLAAHDFVQAASAPRVVLGRAARIEGAPSVASRWLKRLDAAAPKAMKAARARGDVLIAQARALDRPTSVRPCAPPAPTPPLALRPRSLSVTQIETWMRDPYAIYARHVLGLAALDPIDADPGAADRGTFIHKALAAFLSDCAGRWPKDAEDRLLAAGRAAFRTVEDQPGLYAFWWPRFARIAAWFVEHEKQRRGQAKPVAWEVSGRLDLGGFELHARADRIDRLKGGALAIIDYKTGRVPKPADISLGFAPQLTLEGAIAEAGGFAGVAKARIGSLEHWRLSGREGGVVHEIAGGPELVEVALAGLRNLIAAFADPKTPYRAAPHPGFAPDYSDYRHLERIDEWSGPAKDR